MDYQRNIHIHYITETCFLMMVIMATKIQKHHIIKSLENIQDTIRMKILEKHSRTQQ